MPMDSLGAYRRLAANARLGSAVKSGARCRNEDSSSVDARYLVRGPCSMPRGAAAVVLFLPRLLASRAW